MAKKPNVDIQKLGLSGLVNLGADAVTNLFRGNEKTTVDAPKLAQPVTPKGIGEQFLENNITPAAEEVAPVEDVPTPEDVIEQYRTTLKQAGFADNDTNLDRFIQQNPDTTTAPSDFSGLEPPTNEVVKPIHSHINQVLRDIPIFQVFAGLRKPLEILGEGFSRYEAAKSAFITEGNIAGPIEAAPAIGEALTGQAKTKFPEAKARVSQYPELGDLFRELGLPEAISATGGLVLDLLTDLPAGLATSITLPKTSLEAINLIKKSSIADETTQFIRQAGKKFGMENVTDNIIQGVGKATGRIEKELGKQSFQAENEIEQVGRFLQDKFFKYRASELSKMTLDAIKGKGRFDELGPELKQALYDSVGDQRKTVVVSDVINNSMQNLLTDATPDLIKTANNALKGNIDDMGKLPSHLQTIIKQGRQILDNESNGLIKELTDIYNTDRSAFDSIAFKFGVEAGKQIPLPKLIQTIQENMGNYVRRSFALFNKELNWKPTDDLFKQAVKGLIADDVFEDTAQARNWLQSIVDSKQFTWKNLEGKPVKVNTGSFIRRQDMPDYLLKFLGEIDDPRYNFITTAKDLSKARTQLQFFRQLRNTNLVADEATSTLTYKIPEGNSLAWGAVNGKYTNKEVHDYLKGVQITEDSLDDIIVNAMQFLKFAKVVPNVKSSVHNMIGNFMNSLVTGISPISHPQRYFGKDGALDIIKAGWQFKRGKLPDSNPLVQKYLKAVGDTVVDNELPNADNIRILENLQDFFRTHKVPKSIRRIEDATKFVSDLYGAQDQFFKLAHWLEYSGRGLSREATINEVYKHWPNYYAAPKLAEAFRTTPAGVLLANPFSTFRLEMHRILLNHLRDPDTRWKMGLMFASTAATNIALLGLAGNSFKDIYNFFMTRPEALSDIILNPADKNFDLNMEYVDPYNKKGLFAPLTAAAGATGVHPLDYALAFTQFSPEFGYSNLITNVLETGFTGKGQFGTELEPADQIKQLMAGLGPTSFTIDIPRIINPDQPSVEEDNQERLRRVFRFFGIDVEKRNPNYLKTRINKVVKQKIDAGDDPQSILRVASLLGYDPDKTLKSVQTKIKNEQKKKPLKAKTVAQPDLLDRVISSLGDRNETR